MKSRKKPSFSRKFEVDLRLLPLGFMSVISIGTFLLTLPAMHNPGKYVEFTDALFIATSATCVTGLTTLNIAETFNTLGQGVILTLIQLGGVGIMTAGTIFVFLTGNRLSLATERVIVSTFGSMRNLQPKDIFFYSCLFIFVLESIGFIAIFILLTNYCPEQSTASLLWQSAFHSISAFCNAGISIYPNGLMAWREFQGVLIVVEILIIAGGIGTLTLINLMYYKFWKRDALTRGQLTLQSKLILSATAVLIIAGMFIILCLEWGGTLKNSGITNHVHWALFQSITARTAGFNVVDVGQMHPHTLLATMILMFIGGSPGSMAGGIKTITAAIILVTAWSVLKRRRDVEVFKKRIPSGSVSAAIMLMVLAAMALVLCLSLLMITESNQPASETSLRWLAIAFESVSALGTVGLSTGITPLLTTAGKFIVTLFMFGGRVGPLLLAFYLTRPVYPWHIRYPEEDVALG
ncbi:MAG: hypothetical protein K9N48_04340 [Verrucomicrobia bacterium]|nr:hypothetical protein [Verrucomicrobiota bacterium]MCF7709030.1 hypothetical protein [Verrucomicrobiota bacterium]